MTTTPTSGAADLPEALRRSTAADGKTELLNLPGYPMMVRAVDFNRLHTESEMRRTALLDEMQKAALAAEPDPTPGDHPQPCDSELFESGVSVGLFDIPQWTAEALCKGIAAATGARVDWHYIGGRVHVKALPAPTSAEGVAYAALPEYGINTASHAHFRVLGFTTDQMHAFADATHAIRASHGQAPAGAGEVAEHYRNAIASACEGWTMPDGLRKHLETALWSPPTPTARADSVLEDAADPLQGAANWLAEAHGQFSPVVLSGCLMIGYNRAKRLHDAALAARKQGEKHER